MGKWGLWAAHRYIDAGAAVPRTIGPDGRELRAGWRQRSERARQAAVQARSARTQSIWPKVMGWCCIGIAMAGILMWPVPRHVPVSAAVGPAPEHRAFPSSFGAFVCQDDGSFCWDPGEIAGPYTFVLFADDYAELARVDGIEAVTWQPSGAVAEALAVAGTYHAYVMTDQERNSGRSALLTFTRS